MRHRCSHCGFTSERPRFFRREKGGLLQRPKTVCDACTSYQPTISEQRAVTRYFLGIGSLFAVSLLILQNNPGFGAAVVVMVMTAAVTLRLRVFIHEWGHAFAVRQVGGQVWQIDVGSGPLLHKRRLNGFIFNIHRYTFTGGKVWLSPMEGKHIRRRMAVILLAGAMANLVSAALALALAYVLYSVNPFLLPLTVVPSGFALASIVMGLRSLVPEKYADPEPILSDGMQLLHLFRKEGAQPKISVELRAIWLARAHRYGELIQTVGDDWQESHLRLFLASSLMDALSKVRGDQAVVDFYTAHRDRLVIPGKDEDNTAIAWIVGNVAWSAIKLGKEDLRDLADILSMKALEAAPSAAAIQATRGAWLIMAKDTQTGVDLLTRAIRRLDSARDKSEFAVFLAQGFHTLGDHEKAEEYERLSRHQQHCQLVPNEVAPAFIIDS